MICNDSVYVNDTIATVGSGDFLSKSQFHYSVIHTIDDEGFAPFEKWTSFRLQQRKRPSHKMPINCHPLAYLHQFWVQLILIDWI